MTYYVSLNGKRFRGYPRSDCAKGWRTFEQARSACESLARAWPYSGGKKNIWGVI